MTAPCTLASMLSDRMSSQQRALTRLLAYLLGDSIQHQALIANETPTYTMTARLMQMARLATAAYICIIYYI